MIEDETMIEVGEKVGSRNANRFTVFDSQLTEIFEP